MFNAMMDGIKEESVGALFNLQVEVQQNPVTDEAVDGAEGQSVVAGGIQMSAGPEVTSTPQAALSQPLADPDAEAVPAPATRRGNGNGNGTNGGRSNRSGNGARSASAPRSSGGRHRSTGDTGPQPPCPRTTRACPRAWRRATVPCSTRPRPWTAGPTWRATSKASPPTMPSPAQAGTTPAPVDRAVSSSAATATRATARPSSVTSLPPGPADRPSAVAGPRGRVSRWSGRFDRGAEPAGVPSRPPWTRRLSSGSLQPCGQRPGPGPELRHDRDLHHVLGRLRGPDPLDPGRPVHREQRPGRRMCARACSVVQGVSWLAGRAPPSVSASTCANRLGHWPSPSPPSPPRSPPS